MITERFSLASLQNKCISALHYYIFVRSVILKDQVLKHTVSLGLSRI